MIFPADFPDPQHQVQHLSPLVKYTDIESPLSLVSAIVLLLSYFINFLAKRPDYILQDIYE